jgi:hypothetical protein
MKYFNYLHNVAKRGLIFILVLCLIWNSIVFDAKVYALENNDYTIPQCQGLKDEDFKSELQQNIEYFFVNEITKSNIQPIVERNWQDLNLDAIIDYEVDDAVITVKNQTGYWGRFTSNWNSEQAKILTEKIINLAFNDSSAVGAKFQVLSEKVANSLFAKIEPISVESSVYAMNCLQQFIGGQYSQIIVDVFNTNLQSSVEDIGSNINLQPDTVNFIKSHKGGVGGATYLLIKNVIAKRVINQITSRVVQQVSERIGARIAESIIPFFDAVVLLQTIWDFANPDAGLATIRNYIKKPEIKEDFKRRITNDFEREMRPQSKLIAGEIFDNIYKEWHNFKSGYSQLLSIAKELPEFEKILRDNEPAKTSLLLGELLAKMERNKVKALIKDGSFNRLISLPASSYDILKMPEGLKLLFEWVDLSGSQIDDVVKLDLYKHFSPKDLDHQLLVDILSLQEPSVISKLSLLDVASTRKLLSTISKRNLVSIAEYLSANDLQHLAEYLNQVQPEQVNRLLKFLISTPSVIKNPGVMAHILSKDIDAAIRFWEKPVNVFSFLNSIFEVFADFTYLPLVADKYGIPIVLLFIGLPFLLVLALVLATITWFYSQWLKIRQLQQSLGKSDAINNSRSTTEPGN